MNNKPSISVIMAVYNSMNYLSAAVESVLYQTADNFEFIIIDDGSTDGGSAWLERKAKSDERIVLIQQENIGLTKSLNKGLQIARGKYIARMDADDVCLPDRLMKQVVALDSDADLVMVGTEVELIDEAGNWLGPRMQPTDHDEIRSQLLSGNGGAITHPAIMARASALRQVGGYDESFSTTQDLDLFLRLSEIGKVKNLPESLLLWRQHSQSVNRTRSSSWRQLKALAISRTIERVGAQRYARELFACSPVFSFHSTGIELAIYAARNRRYATAVKYLWRELVSGQRRTEALIGFFSLIYFKLKR